MSTAEDTAIEKANWHWRNTMRPVRFFSYDARAAIPVFILLFHFRLYMIIFNIIVLLIFHILEKKGLTLPAALRALRVWLLGDKRPGWISLRHRQMKDYG